VSIDLFFLLSDEYRLERQNRKLDESALAKKSLTGKEEGVMNKVKAKKTKGRIGKWLSCLFVNVPVFAYIVFVLTVSQPVYAAVFNCPSGDVSCLIEKVNQANANGEANTIILANGTYSLGVDNIDGGKVLPSIDSMITIIGNGSIIDGNMKRIFHVAAEGELTVLNLTVRNGGNWGLGGGGIFNRGTLKLINSTVSGNDGDPGGGIHNCGGYLKLDRSTVSNNRGWYAGGGGIYNSDNGTIRIVNSTISGNYNVSLGINVPPGQGAGIHNAQGNIELISSTVSDNDAGWGGWGGIFNNFGTVELTNCIVAENRGYSSVSNCSYGITSHGHNLENSDTCNLDPAKDDLLNTAAFLGPLADNGGPTLTHALLSGSQAIDNGDDTVCPATDQRGFHRPYGTHCDIGAYGYGAHEYAFITAIAKGSQTPKVDDPPFTTDDPMVKNGGFTITPDGFDPGHTQSLGDGVDEGTSWRFDFTNPHALRAQQSMKHL